MEEGELTAPQELTLQSHTMGRMTFGKEPGVTEVGPRMHSIIHLVGPRMHSIIHLVGPSMHCNHTFSWSQNALQSCI